MLSSRIALLAFSALSFVVPLSAMRPVASAQAAVRGNREATALNVSVGEQIVLPAQGVKTYSEGVHGIVDIRLTGDASRFVIVGVTPGVTTLLCIMIDNSEQLYNITVVDPRAGQAAPTAPNNPMAVAPLASIRLDLYFVQIDRNRSLGVGMDGTDKIGGLNVNTAFDVLLSQYTAKSATVVTNFVPQLSLAQARGWAKVARHVALITANGNEATFDSGGEVNVLRNTGLSQSVVAIKYGAQLSIKPRFDAVSGRIELSVKTEISDLAPSTTGVPGRTLSNVQTMSNLAIGESLAVAGLASRNAAKSRSGLPYLSQIPIIGFLFGKTTETSTDTENVLIIAPSIVQPMQHPRGRDVLASAMREFDSFTEMGDDRHLFPGKSWSMPDTRLPVVEYVAP